jgi:enoyl-CoA hydratase/carnithine racemase
MDYRHIIYAKAEHVAYMTINRPEVRNALNVRANAELRDAFQDFKADDEARVAILTGVGSQAFCAGADLRDAADMFAAGDRPSDLPPFGGITEDFTCWKPIIAAVNGTALGGGTELALACDIVVASSHAQFGLPEPRRGVVAGSGGLVRLPRQLPLKLALGLILTGRPMTAAQAERHGLVNEVVPGDEVMACAQGWAQDILWCSPASVRLSKRQAMSYLHLPVDDALATQADLIAALLASPDASEGTRAFVERREPRWAT